MQFSAPAKGMWLISSPSPIGHTKVECPQPRTKLNQKSTVLSTTEAMVYDMNYDLIINADHYGCCYDIQYEKGQSLTYARLMNLKLSQCVLDEQKLSSTIFSYNVQCDQLRSVLSNSAEFIYIGDGGCRDEDNLAPSRYWHDKLEFHSCQLQCIQDNTCLGIMYFYDGRWRGRCLVYTSSTSLLLLYQDGNVIPHQGWKWIEADPSPRFDQTQRRVVQTMGSIGSGRCFAKNVLSAESGNSENTENTASASDYESESEPDDHTDSELTIRVSDISQQDPLALPWPNQPGIFEMMYNRGHTLNKVCILGQLHRSNFPSVDGEYILMNRRVHHNSKSVWYNKLNGYYLYWNTVEDELQIFDDMVDDDYFAALEKGKYWKLNAGEQDAYDQFLRLIPHACPETTCIKIDSVVSVDPLPFSVDKAWIEINSIKEYVATNKTNANGIVPAWNQKFCFRPSPIALLQLSVSDLYIPNEDSNVGTSINEAVLGKFHISPLTEGVIIRPIHPSELMRDFNADSPVLVQVEVELNDWNGEGLYDPNEYALRSSLRSSSSSNSIGDTSSFRIEADRNKWIGYIGQQMTMIVHAFGTKENNVDWSLINPGSFEITINNLMLPDSESGSPVSGSYNGQNLTALMSHALSQWTISKSDMSSNSDEEDKVISAIMLNAVPRKKVNYQIVVVAYEKDGDQSASIVKLSLYVVFC